MTIISVPAGDSRCFLFTVSPRLRVYTATGYNEHYMYLNHGQQTMPNGLVGLLLLLLLLLSDIQSPADKLVTSVFSSPPLREWAVSTGTSACGWTATSAAATAARGPSAPPTAAPGSPARRTSPWTRWRCGRWADPPRRRRSEPLHLMDENAAGRRAFPLGPVNKAAGRLAHIRSFRVFQDEDGGCRKSVLDADLEVQAMMEMTGKTLHSQGLREPEEDQ